MEKLDRQTAWQLLATYVDEPSLLQHSLIVETIMRHFAELNHADADVWGVVGLLHDMDWQKYPDQHCFKTAEILRAHHVDEVYIHGIMSHSYGIDTDVMPSNLMEKTLFTIDELSGLIVAVTKMMPSHSINDVKVKSVRKKFNRPAFAAGVNRDIINQGLAMLDMNLDDVIQECLTAMQANAAALNLTA